MSVPTITVPRDQDWERSKGPAWGRVSFDRAPMFLCECGRRSLMKGHTVQPDGKVIGSIACRACPFHVFATLEGWADP